MTKPQPLGDCDSPIFIVGCARSGTALLRNLLRSHPRLSFPDESHFIPSLYHGFGDPESEAAARRLAQTMLSNMWVKRWRLSLTPDDFVDCRSFREVLCRLYGEWARSEGKPRWGDKTPHYLTSIPLLHKLFPDARFLHIYRDGRDVAISWLRSRMEPRNTYMAARCWADRVAAGIRDGRGLPPGSYMEVRYEDLTRDSEEVMRRVCDFIGEPFCEQVLTPNRPPVGTVSSYERKKRWSGDRPLFKPFIVSGNSELWRTKMTERQRVMFESVAGDLLEELGYELVGPRRHVPGPEGVFWRAHHAVLYITARITSPTFGARLRSYVQLRKAKLLGS